MVPKMVPKVVLRSPDSEKNETFRTLDSIDSKSSGRQTLS